MSYIFSARFKDHNQQEDFLWLEMLTPNRKQVQAYIPKDATNVDISQWDFLPNDAVIDVVEAAE